MKIPTSSASEVAGRRTYEALAAFAESTTTPEERRSALTTLITAKALPKLAEDPAVGAGLDLLIASATAAPEPVHRLLAIAESVRLGQVVRRWMPEIAARLKPAFASTLPEMRLLPEAADRLNLARACSLMSEDWLKPYLARAIADEETGEKPRAELVSALLKRSPSLADAVGQMSAEFKRLRPPTEEPGDTVARRMTRTLSALREATLESELPVGDNLGRGLHNFISAPLAAVGNPQDEKAKLDLVRETLSAVHQIVRTHISVVADPEMYLAVAYGRKLCGGSTWPNGLKKPLDHLITDVTEALVLLGRQGRCDQTLLGQLDVLCNHPERARAVARDLASKHPELSEEVRDWLLHGRIRTIRQASDSGLEAIARNADEGIGQALCAARQTRLLRGSLEEALVSTLEVFDPSLLAATREFLERILVLIVNIEQVAAIRGLDLVGTPGEEVEVSAKYFAVAGGKPKQRMTVRQPAVVRKRSDQTAGEVVIRGLVE